MKKTLNKPFVCPLCGYGNKWGYLVKHIAYKGDSKHEQWRKAHGFPATIPFGHHNQYEPLFRIKAVPESDQ